MPEPLTHEPEGTALPPLLADLGLLLETNAAPVLFFAEFLQRVVPEVKAAGGAKPGWVKANAASGANKKLLEVRLPALTPSRVMVSPAAKSSTVLAPTSLINA